MTSNVPESSKSHRLNWWLVGIGVALVMIGTLVLVAVYGPHRQMASEVERLQGSVKWRGLIGTLEEIELPRGGATDEWVARQEWWRFDSLQRLALKRCELSDDGLKPLKELKQLKWLDVEGNPKITPKGLSELRTWTNLRRLDLDAFILSHDDAIENLSRLSQVKELYFYGRGIEPERLDELRKAMPGTKIDVFDPTASSMAFRSVYLRAAVHVAFHPSGKWLASGDGHGRLRLWDIENQELVWNEQAHTDWVFGLAFAPSGNVLATSGGDNKIRLWDVAQRKLLATLEGHDDDVHSIAFTPDGTTLLSSSDDMTVRRWQLGDLEQLAQHTSTNDWVNEAWEGHDDTIPALALSSDGHWAASGSRDGTVRLWNLETQKTIHTLRHSIHKRPRDGDGVAPAAFDVRVSRGDVMGVAFHPQAKRLASIGYDGDVRIWDVESGEQLTEWHAHTGWAFGVDFSPRGDLLATCGRQGSVVLWNESGERQRDFQADDDVACVKFSPDGCRLAACTANGQIKIWPLETFGSASNVAITLRD